MRNANIKWQPNLLDRPVCCNGYYSHAGLSRIIPRQKIARISEGGTCCNIGLPALFFLSTVFAVLWWSFLLYKFPPTTKLALAVYNERLSYPGFPFRNLQSNQYQVYYHSINRDLVHNQPEINFPSRSYYPAYRSRVACTFDKEDIKILEQPVKDSPKHPLRKISRYIVINEPRSGSSWLQEMSQMHPGIKVQFELDMQYGEAALQCKQCFRPLVPDTKYRTRIPPKLHPPMACGMTIFGSSNQYPEVTSLATAHNASLVILLRINHVAQAVSSFLHFGRRRGSPAVSNGTLIPWSTRDLQQNVQKMIDGYEKLLQFPARTGRPSHILFYEDLKRNPSLAWRGLERFLNLPPADVEDLSGLERKSTSKPSIHYLSNLPRLQRDLAGAAWRAMLTDPAYDDKVDVDAVFAGLCSRFPTAQLSWRKGSCPGLLW